MGRLESEQTISLPRSEVFPFFADALNLQAITPPWLRFRIVTPPPIVMRRGTLIDYRLRLRGVPVRWTSEITAWEPPSRFVDEQRRGPYRRWIHEHTCAEHDGQTVMCDRVDYLVPGGRLVDRLLVKRDLERIFAYRKARIAELLTPPTEG